MNKKNIGITVLITLAIVAWVGWASMRDTPHTQAGVRASARNVTTGTFNDTALITSRIQAQAQCDDTREAHCVRADGEDTADAVANTDPLAACKKQILANMVFPGTHCPNVMEDDPRLNNTWNEMYARALACIDKQFDTGTQCEYGTQAQRLSIYASNEQGTLFINN